MEACYYPFSTLTFQFGSACELSFETYHLDELILNDIIWSD